MVIGASGSGKSTFIARLVEGLGKEKRVLILDWYGEYAGLGYRLIPGVDVCVNPFWLGFDHGWDSIEEILFYTTQRSEFSPIQYEVARRAALQVEELELPLTPLTLYGALSSMNIKREDEKNAAAAVKRRLSRLTEKCFNRSLPPPEDKGIYVIDLSSLKTDYEKTVFTWFLLQNLYYNPPGRETVLILDEAQRLAPRFLKTKTFLERLMDEGRKHGVKIIAATQTPSTLHNSVINNAETIAVFHCTGVDAEIAAKALSPSRRRELIAKIEKLATGECIISQRGRIAHVNVKPGYTPKPPPRKHEHVDQWEKIAHLIKKYQAGKTTPQERKTLRKQGYINEKGKLTEKAHILLQIYQ